MDLYYDGENITFRVTPIVSEVDLNIVCYVFNWETDKTGNKGKDKKNRRINKYLCRLNKLNDNIAEKLGYHGLEHIGSHKFMISKTTFEEEGYGDSPKTFLEKSGIGQDQWGSLCHKVTVLRSTIMNPYLDPTYIGENYIELFMTTFKDALESIVKNKDDWDKIIFLPKDQASCCGDTPSTAVIRSK